MTATTSTGFGDFATFADAAEGVMEILESVHGIDAWFITRIRLDDWLVTHLRGPAPFARGELAPVPANMRDAILRKPLKADVERELEAVAERHGGPDAVPAFSYIGAPLIVNDVFYGALCGLDTSSLFDEKAQGDDSPSLAMAARLLSTILRLELEADQVKRRAERAEAEALVDEMTGLFNRRGWERLVGSEEDRAGRYEHAAAVFVMDVDDLKRTNDGEGHAAGDELLRKVGQTIKSVIREHDVAARIGGDEFAVLAVESDADDVSHLHERLQNALTNAGIPVSIGWAHREFAGGINAAIERADAAMYASKAERKK